MVRIALKMRYDNGDRQQRYDLGIDGLLNAESTVEWLMRTPTPLQRAYAVWEDRKRSGYVRQDDFRLTPADGISTCMMDVTAEDPARYRFTAFNVLCVQELAGKVIAEHPIPQLRSDLMCEYSICKASRQVMAYRIVHAFGNFRRDYLRLLLPLCDRTGSVTALACLSRHLAAPAGSLRSIRPA
jgi:hypothetical protein